MENFKLSLNVDRSEVKKMIKQILDEKIQEILSSLSLHEMLKQRVDAAFSEDKVSKVIEKTVFSYNSYLNQIIDECVRRMVCKELEGKQVSVQLTFKDEDDDDYGY